MRAVFIHSAKDLRVEPITVADPGPGEVRVSVGAGGICGQTCIITRTEASARSGAEPMILGPRVAGTVTSTAGVVRTAHQRIAINPARARGQCRREASTTTASTCAFGGAMRFPMSTAPRDAIVIDGRKPRSGRRSLNEAPSASRWRVPACRGAGRAAARAARAVTGCGPIGCLTILAARRASALTSWRRTADPSRHGAPDGRRRPSTWPAGEVMAGRLCGGEGHDST
jgi:L-idonate 5-dehydrogenase